MVQGGETMIPTLAGRIQTRLLLFVLLGIPLTALFSWLWLPLYWDLLFLFLLTVLATVNGFGLIMDVVYIGLQRLRWDRDWPFAYQFFFSIVEFAIVLWAARAGLIPWLPAEALAGTDGLIMASSHFATVFIPSFLALLGPISVFFIRWRFKAGQLGKL